MLTVKYDDFSGGYWGDASDARPNQDNKWYGRNVRVYPTGQIGPRYPTGSQTLSGLSGSLGVITVGAVTTTAAPYVLLTADNGALDIHFYRTASASSNTWTLTDNGNLGTSVVPSGYVLDERNSKIAFGGVNKSFTIGSTTAGTFTTAKYVAKHGERAVGTDASVKSRMVYSDAADFYTWGAGSFIDIGDGAENIAYVSANNNQLYVAKTNGIWLVSGVLGSTATVRKMASVNIRGGQGYRGAFVRSTQGLIGFVRDDGIACLFDGARVVDYPEQGTGWEFVSSLPGGYIAWYIRGTSVNDVLLREPNGAFSRHTFSSNGSTSAHLFPNYAEEKYQPDNTYFDQYVWIGDQNKMHRWVVAVPGAQYGGQSNTLSPDYPLYGNTNDYSTSGQVQGVFYLPEYYSTSGKVLRVRNVTVQFTKFKIAAGLTNEIVAQAVAKGSYESGDVTSTALTWSESSNSATATGTEDSVRFSFGDQGFGNGFQIQFTSLKGVTIKEVVVQCDERNRRA